MSIPQAIAFLVVGLGLLWISAEALVAGAVGLARRLGVSSLVIGLTVVAMGTSAPEVAASIAATLRSQGDIAVGNVFGSNIANLALVGGLISLIRPLEVRKSTLLREIPVMLLVAGLLWPVLRDLGVTRPEGAGLLIVFAAFVALTVLMAKRDSEASMAAGTSEAKPAKLGRCVFFVVFGLAGLACGAEIVRRGAVTIGASIGMSDAVIGSTIVAVGTSLPELITCVVAAIRGQHDISVGNLVGSNIFNTLLVTGGAALVRPFSIERRFAGGIDFWIMIGVSAAFGLGAILGGRKVGRRFGSFLVLVYAGYIAYLLLYAPPPT